MNEVERGKLIGAPDINAKPHVHQCDAAFPARSCVGLPRNNWLKLKSSYYEAVSIWSNLACVKAKRSLKCSLSFLL